MIRAIKLYVKLSVLHKKDSKSSHLVQVNFFYRAFTCRIPIFGERDPGEFQLFNKLV